MAASDYWVGLSAPRGQSYQTPEVSFDWLGNLPKRYQEGEQYGRLRQQQTAFQGGVPRLPNGEIDTRAITDTLFRLGGTETAAPLAQKLIGGDIYRQMMGGQGGPGGPATGQPAVQEQPPGSMGSHPYMSSQSNNGAGPSNITPDSTATGQKEESDSLTSLASSVFGDMDASPYIKSVATKMQVDPGAPLDPTRLNLAKQLLGREKLKLASASQDVSSLQGSPGPSQAIGPAASSPAPPNTPQGNTVVAQAPTQGGLPSSQYTTREANRLEAEASYLRRSAGALSASGFPTEAAKAQLDEADNKSKQAKEIREFLANRSKSQYEVGLEGQKKGITGLAEAKTKQVGEVIESGGKAARDTINSLNTIEDAVKAGGKNIVFGPGAENWQKVKQVLNNIYPQAGLAEADTITKMNARLAAQAAKQMTARPTQLEFRTFMANNPGLMNSKAGTLALINILRQTTQQDIALGKLASGIRDPNEWADAEEKFYKGKEGKLISPFTGKPMGEAEAPKASRSSAATKLRWTPDGGVKPY